MDLKYEPAVGLNVSHLPNIYMPELSMTLWNKPELPYLTQSEKMKLYNDFSKTFDHFEFYADLENRLRVNEPLVLNGLRKLEEEMDMERFLDLYLRINTEENDFTVGLRTELDEIREEKANKKAKQKPTPRPSPSPSGDSEEDPKKKPKPVPSLSSMLIPQKPRLS